MDDEKKRLSYYTVKEIGAAIKPALEKKIKRCLKPPETGKIVHVSDSEIILNDFKIEISPDPFKPSYPRVTWFLIGLAVGFFSMLMGLPEIEKEKSETPLIAPPPPLAVIKKQKPTKAKTAAKPPIAQPATAPLPVPKLPLPSDVMDDVTDTLSPSGRPLQPPSPPPAPEPVADED